MRLTALKSGERQALNNHPRPLVEREPLLVWRSMALVSLLLNLLLTFLLLK